MQKMKKKTKKNMILTHFELFPLFSVENKELFETFF